MAKKKKYKIKGTKDFLILTIVCAVLCVWSVRDGWFPSAKVLKKHPPELVLAFDSDGIVLRVDAKAGAPAKPGMLLAKLATATTEKQLRARELEYTQVRDAGDEKMAAEKLQQLLELRNHLAASELKVAERYLIEIDENGQPQVVGSTNDERDPDFKRGYKPENAIVKKVLVKRNRRVVGDEPAVVLNTKDHFYPFNKVLAVIAGVGILLFGILHFLASKD